MGGGSAPGEILAIVVCRVRSTASQVRLVLLLDVHPIVSSLALLVNAQDVTTDPRAANRAVFVELAAPVATLLRQYPKHRRSAHAMQRSPADSAKSSRHASKVGAVAGEP